MINISKTYQGKPCKNGHRGIRYISGRTCIDCVRNSQKTLSYKKVKSTYEIVRRKSEKYLIYKSAYRKSENFSLSQRKHRKTLKRKNSNDKFAKSIKGKNYLNNYMSLRRADKIKRTPKWSNLVEIEKIYAQATALTIETGIRMHVDHIIPLKGEMVSGLHVPGNLKIIPAMDNFIKNNKLLEELL